MRIFTAALVAETNTFAAAPTGYAAFELSGGRRTADGSRDTLGIRALVDTLRSYAGAEGHEVAVGLCAGAKPRGLVTRDAHEALRDEIVFDLRNAAPVGAVLLLLHGATVADGCDDVAGDLLERVRAEVGPHVRVGALLDLHCHFTERMRAAADVLVCFKEYPHVDVRERAAEVYRLTVDAGLGRIHPVTAVHDCRMIGLWPTTHPPVREFVDRMREHEGRDGVLSISFGHGFPWGDVPECGAKVWVIADGDAGYAAALAAELGEAAWALRDAGPRQLTIDEALDRALASGSGPVVLADADDNPGGGAPGDSTFVLRRMVERGVGDAAVGCLCDAAAVRICREAGAGASLLLRVGGKSGPESGDPLDVRVTVRALREDHSQDVFGERSPLGPSAWVTTTGGIDVVLASDRQQVVGQDAFTGIGVDVGARRVVVVKSAVHFRAAFEPLARAILDVATPGLLSRDFARLPFRKRDGNYWPRVADPHVRRRS